MDFVIRRAVASDIKHISSVHITSWKESYKNIINKKYLNNLDSEENKKSWKNIFFNSNSWIYVVYVDKKLVWFMNFGLNRTSIKKYIWELYAIYILEKYQKKYIWKALINKMKSVFQKNNISSNIVGVYSENKAKKFYKKCGYKFLKTKKINVWTQCISEDYYWIKNNYYEN